MREMHGQPYVFKPILVLGKLKTRKPWVNMKYYLMGDFVKTIGKNPQALREWNKKDILKPHHVAPNRL